MELSSADRALAASIAAAHPLSADGGPGYYRVEGDWCGGGFGVTRHFPSALDAQTWGEHKARHHRDAVVTVTPREEVPL